jgi:hypothetical protein
LDPIHDSINFGRFGYEFHHEPSHSNPFWRKANYSGQVKPGAGSRLVAGWLRPWLTQGSTASPL